MINKNEIKFGEPIYYMPSYSGTSIISVLKLLDNERVLVNAATTRKTQELPN